jgi:ATP-dependent DNA ligase
MEHPMAIFKYPMKPIRVNNSIFSKIDASKYLLEKKYDGWRAIVVFKTEPYLFTREKRIMDIPHTLYDEFKSMNIPDGTILDGEIWNPTDRGKWKTDLSAECMLTFWDIMKHANQDLSTHPLESRIEILRKIISPTEHISIVQQYKADIESHDRFYADALEHKKLSQARSGYIHGVVLKKRDSPRRDHIIKSIEHPDWLKIVFPGMQSGTIK